MFLRMAAHFCYKVGDSVLQIEISSLNRSQENADRIDKNVLETLTWGDFSPSQQWPFKGLHPLAIAQPTFTPPPPTSFTIGILEEY
jgi:hypothetical protein